MRDHLQLPESVVSMADGAADLGRLSPLRQGTETSISVLLKIHPSKQAQSRGKEFVCIRVMWCDVVYVCA